MKLLRAIIAWLMLHLFARRREKRRKRALEQRIVAPADPSPRAELVVAALLLGAGLAAALFVVLYAIRASTQLLGLALGGALALLAVALIVLAKGVLVTEHLTEEYPEPSPEDADAVAQILSEGGDGITRKGLLIAAGGAAGVCMAAAAVAPAVGLGPRLDTEPLYRTPWRRGRRLVDEHNAPVRADDIDEGAFYTAFPEGASKDLIGSPLVLVRLPVGQLELPPGRAAWAPEGILAYSKICTHAGCAIALYRSPKFDPVQPNPALVCPCHYSTFNPATGATVEFGPAGRPLPQLPLMIGPGRVLQAAGNFSGPVGPGWSGVRSGRPT